MIFVQQLITASESLLVEAIKVSNGLLKEYYIAHLEEERGHETWLSEDLLTIGIDVKILPLNRRAVELAGSQYYLIKHVHPACLLGYMAVLEGRPILLANVELLEKIHGKSLLRTLRYHAEHDRQHSDDVFRMIDANPYPEILENAIQTALSINAFMKELA